MSRLCGELEVVNFENENKYIYGKVMYATLDFYDFSISSSCSVINGITVA